MILDFGYWDYDISCFHTPRAPHLVSKDLRLLSQGHLCQPEPKKLSSFWAWSGRTTHTRLPLEIVYKYICDYIITSWYDGSIYTYIIYYVYVGCPCIETNKHCLHRCTAHAWKNIFMCKYIYYVAYNVQYIHSCRYIYTHIWGFEPSKLWSFLLWSRWTQKYT